MAALANNPGEFCRRCGAPVASAEVAQCGRCGAVLRGDLEALVEQTWAKCPACAAPHAVAAKFCGHCGRSLQAAPPPPPPVRPTPPALPPRQAPSTPVKQAVAATPQPKNNGGCGGCGCLLILLLIGGGIYSWFSQSPTVKTPAPTISTPRETSQGLPSASSQTPKPALPPGEIADVRTTVRVVDPSGYVGMRFSARCRLNNGWRGQLVARAYSYPDGQLKRTLSSAFAAPGPGQWVDCSMIIPHEPFSNTAGDNQFYCELVLLDDAGREVAKTSRGTALFREGFCDLLRVRAFPRMVDTSGRPGTTFAVDISAVALTSDHCRVVIHFRDGPGGSFVKSRDPRYADANGNLVIAAEAPSASGPRRAYRDIALFLPADAVGFRSSAAPLQGHASLWDDAGKQYLCDPLLFDVPQR